MMPIIRRLSRQLAPPLLFQFLKVLRKPHGGLAGTFASWDEAASNATGYNSPEILGKVKDALLKVKRGEAVYERDSVLFEEPEYSFPVLAGLLHIAIAKDGKLNVLDFGGSLGSSYFQCRSFLSGLKDLHWNIVEQEQFVRCGKDLFENNELKFYYNIKECIQYEKPDVVLLSSVLQYLKDPYALLDEIGIYGLEYIIIDRTPCAKIDSDLITTQIVPAEIYKARLPFRIFSENALLGKLRDKYALRADFPAIDSDMKHDNMKVQFRGYIFQKLP